MIKKIKFLLILLFIFFVLIINTFAEESSGDCSACGGKLKEFTVGPTCTKDGYTQERCDSCGKDYGSKYNIKNKLGHYFSGDKHIKINDEEHAVKCDRCSAYKEITKEKHLFDIYHKCATCNFELLVNKKVQHRFNSDLVCIYNGCNEKLVLIDSDYENAVPRSGYVPSSDTPSQRGSATIAVFKYPPLRENGIDFMTITVDFEPYQAQTMDWHTDWENLNPIHKTPGQATTFSVWYSTLSANDKIGGKIPVTGSKTGEKSYSFSVPGSDRRYFTYLKADGHSVANGEKRMQKGSSPIQVETRYDITVKYVNAVTNKEISVKKEYTKKQGASFEEPRETFTNYTFVRSEVNGKVDNSNPISVTASQNTEIIFYYNPVWEITVKHIDQSSGETILEHAPEYLENGNTYTETKLEPIKYPEYKFDKSTVNGKADDDTVTGTANDNKTIIFYYNQMGKIWVRGIDNSTGNTLYDQPKDDIVINRGGTEKTYTASAVNGYKVLGYTIENSLISSIRIPTIPGAVGNKATAKVDVGDGNREKLITFIYDVDDCGVSLKVTHKDEASDTLIPDVSPNPNSIDLNKLLNIFRIRDETFRSEYFKITMGNASATDKTKQALTKLKSYWESQTRQEFQSLNLHDARYTEYINRYVNIGGVKITTRTNGQQINEKGRYTPSIDAAIAGLMASGSTVQMTFYYIKSTVEVTHFDKTKNEKINEPIKISTPTIVESLSLTGKLAEYINAGYTLDGKVGSGPLDRQYSVNVTAIGKINKQLTFYYRSIVPPDPEPGGDPIPVLAIAEAINGGSQKVGSATIPQWTVDEPVKIKITNTGVHDQLPAKGTKDYNVSNAREIQIRFPFDVYLNGALIKNFTWIKVLEVGSINPTNEITFKVPSWVPEREYRDEIYIRTISKTAPATVGTELGRINANDLTASPADPNSYTAYTRVSAEVIGKVEDLTVTYLEGDTMWQKSLFEKVDASGKPIIEEYRAAGLPLGQNVNKPDKYSYGIKLGSPFLFSINTKGAKSSKVIVEPKVLHISSAGAVEEIDLFYYVTGKKLVKMADQLEMPLKTILNKQTRLDNTNNILKELVDGKKAYVNTIDYSKERELGKYARLILGDGMRLPYSNYLTQMATIFPGAGSYEAIGVSEASVLKGVSHWYGDYKLPSTALAATKDATISGTITENSPMFANYKTGYLLVCFKVTTEETNGAYLSYGQTQWAKEGYTAGAKQVTLPTGTVVTIPASFAEYCPVALYQAGLRINNDFEVGGTH